MSEPLSVPAVAVEPQLPSTEARDPIFDVIERAARDPQVDIDKFERLMKMRERAQAERAKADFVEAFTKLWPELPIIDQKGRLVVYSKVDRDKPGGPTPNDEPIQVTAYSRFDDILEAVRKPLADHGFAVRFEFSAQPVGESFRMITKAVLTHKGGHSIEASTPPLTHDATGSKNAVQAVGSSLSYGKRYALLAVLPIVSHAPEDLDDDGKMAGSKFIGIDDIAFLEQQIRDTGSDKAKLLETLAAPSIAEITVKQFNRAKALLVEKKRRAAGSKK